MQNTTTTTTAEVMGIAGKAAYVALRNLHQKTASKAIHEALRALHFPQDAQDATIAADCLQAARATLAEYCLNYQYTPFQVIGHKRTGREITPFSLACNAVNKVISNSAGQGMKGQTNAVIHCGMKSVPLDEHTGTYTDDTSALDMSGMFDGRYADMVEYMRDGYDMRNIAEKLGVSLPRVYQMRDTIRKRLLDTGLYEAYR